MDTQATLDATEAALDVIEDKLEAIEQVVTVTRNNPALIAGALILGAAVGGVVGYKIAEKRLVTKFEDILAQEIAEAKEFYSRMNKTDQFSTPEGAVEALVPPEAVEAMQQYQGREGQVPYDKVPPREIKGEPEVVVENATVVTNVFSDARPDPRDWDYDAELVIRETNPESPYVISFEEYQENEHSHEQATLTYFAGDDTLCDEKSVPIPDTEYSVGDDNLTRFGHGSHDRNVVYIRNERVGMDWEVIRSEGTYQHEVLSQSPRELRHSDRSNRRSRRGRDE